MKNLSDTLLYLPQGIYIYWFFLIIIEKVNETILFKSFNIYVIRHFTLFLTTPTISDIVGVQRF